MNTRSTGYYLPGKTFCHPGLSVRFLVLWVALIVWGVLPCPGWNLFWPWHEWDHISCGAYERRFASSSRHPFLTGAFVFGALWGTGRCRPVFRTQEQGRRGRWVRFGVKAFLFLTMMLLPLKMILRLAFNIKYVWVTPWFNL